MLSTLQMRCKKSDRPLPCIRRIGGAIAVFIIWILKCMPGVGIDLDVDALPK